MNFFKVSILLFNLSLLSTNVVLGQPFPDDGGDEITASNGIANVVRIKSAPEMDGEVKLDPVWRKIKPVGGTFWQIRPDEGQPISEKTEVRLTFTEKVLYIGVICYDRDPSQIIVSDSRRDASLDETDSFQFILDTYNDNQNGFLFGTNPAAIEYDAQITSEGRDSFGGGPRRQQSGSGGGFNLNWDGSWEVRTKISDIGWSAEFAIPFRTLRFSSAKEQTWGVNFQRNIRRRNERAYWMKLPRQYNIQRVSLAGTLTGLENIQQKNLKVMPYTLGEIVRDFGNDLDTEVEGDFGFDLKYSLTPSVTLDATYNTDFAQVEVDEQQINFDRFNLFFPEKRAFFLENAGLFSVGDPGEVELFFSRRIGIGEDGLVVPIVAGGRVSGKVAGLNIGLLNMQTESLKFVDPDDDETTLIPTNNFAVIRINKELPHRSSIGGIFVNRQASGDFAAGDDYNRTYALDGRWGIGQYGQLSGFVAQTATAGVSEDEHAYRFSARYNSQAWRLSASYTEVSEQFNPEVGFLQRSGYRKPDFLIFNTIRPKNFLGFWELRPHASYNGFWNFDGFQESGRLHVDNHWVWRSGAEVHTGVNFTREGISPFSADNDSVFIQDVFVPPGTYDHVEVALVGNTNPSSWWQFRFRGTRGGFFGGNRLSLSNTLRFRLGETFNTEIIYRYNDIDLPEGDFVTNLFRVRSSYSFTPRIFVQGLIQYNDRNDIWSTNLRFGWLQTANTGLFVVFNDVREIDSRSIETQSRSLIIKYSQVFDLLR